MDVKSRVGVGDWEQRCGLVMYTYFTATLTRTAKVIEQRWEDLDTASIGPSEVEALGGYQDPEGPQELPMQDAEGAAEIATQTPSLPSPLT